MTRMYRPVEVRKITHEQLKLFRTKTKLQLICDECDTAIHVGDYFALDRETLDFAGFRCKNCFSKLMDVIHNN